MKNFGKTLKNLGKTIKHNALYFLLFIYGVVYVCYFFIGVKNPTSHDIELSKIEIDGSIQIDDGEVQVYEGPEILQGLQCQRVYIKGNFSEAVGENLEIFTKLEQLQCTIKINGETVFVNEFDFHELWGSFKSRGILPTDTVEIELKSFQTENSNAFEHALEQIYSGDRAVLLHHQLKKYSLSILLTVIILIFGIVVLVVAIILGILGVQNVRQYFVCGILTISGAMCCFLNYDYIQLLIPQINGVRALDYFNQVIVSTALLVYLRCYMQNAKSRFISRIISYVWVVAIFFNFGIAHASGRGQPIMYVEMLIIMTALVAVECFFLFREYKITENYDVRGLFLGSGLLTLGTIVEIMHYIIYNWFWYWSLEIGLALFVVIQLVVLINISRRGLKQAMRVKEMEKEVMQANIYTMVSQIQPHFLYNTLGTIKALVNFDKTQALDVLDAFSKYLRANMQSLTQQTPIPFGQELEHVKNYLYIEQVRFGDKMRIIYDLETTDFDCPGLILQTTVENAVKHGIGNKKGGGTIWIRTWEEDKFFIIQVEDDGVGFDVDLVPNDEKTHVGIANSKNRLKGMCGGSYTVSSAIGRGTMVTMKIPKNNNYFKPYESLY